jgi:hypothetical protein
MYYSLRPKQGAVHSIKKTKKKKKQKEKEEEHVPFNNAFLSLGSFFQKHGAGYLYF